MFTGKGHNSCCASSRLAETGRSQCGVDASHKKKGDNLCCATLTCKLGIVKSIN